MVANVTVNKTYGGPYRQTARADWTTGETGSSDWVRFEAGDITAQLSGAATSVTVVVERSGVEPTSVTTGGLAAPADDSGFSGDLSLGIPPNVYQETGVGWWRFRVVASSGGAITGTLSGNGDN